MSTPTRTSEYTVSWSLEAAHLPELHAMFEQEWWTSGRPLDRIEVSVANSEVVVVTDTDDRLAAFLRVVTDYRYFAVVLDVIVRDDLRGHGLGRRLMDGVFEHPRLQQLAGIGLQCEPDKVPFYEKWGFSSEPGRTLQMKRRLSPTGSDDDTE